MAPKRVSTWQWNLARLNLPRGHPLRWTQSHSPVAILRPALDIALQMVGADACCLHLVDCAESKLRLVGCTDEVRQCLSGADDSWLDTCLARQAYNSSDALLVRDLEDIPEACCAGLARAEMQSAMCISIESAARALGTIAVFSRDRGRFSPENVGSLSIVRHYIGAAVDAAFLYGSGREKLEWGQGIRHIADVWPALLSLRSAANTQSRLLQRLDLIYDHFSSPVVNGSDITTITESLAEVIGAPVLVFDRFSKLLACDAAGIGIDQHIIDAVREGGVGKATFNSLTTAGSGEIREVRARRVTVQLPRQHQSDVSLVLAPIVAANDLLGYVVVVEASQRLDVIDFKALEHAGIVLALEMRRQKDISKIEDLNRGAFLRDVLAGFRPIDETVLHESRKFGLDLSEVERVLVVETTSSIRGTASMTKPGGSTSSPIALAEMVQSVCSGVAYTSAQEFSDFSGIVVLYLSRGSDNGSIELRPRDLAELLVEKAKTYLSEMPISVGIGRRCSSVEELRQSFLDAWRCLRVSLSLHSRSQVASFDDLGVIRVLLGCEDRPEEIVASTDQMLKPLLDYDQHHRSELVRSVQIWFENNCNLQKASRAAFVHVSTMKYRLGKVEEICHLDLSNSEDRLCLQVALKVAGFTANGRSDPRACADATSI